MGVGEVAARDGGELKRLAVLVEQLAALQGRRCSRCCHSRREPAASGPMASAGATALLGRATNPLVTPFVTPSCGSGA